jgi:hypothetical protein
MLTSSLRVIQFEPPPGVGEAGRADLADADLALELLGPPQLARAAHLLAESARTPSWDEYADSKARFIEAAKAVLYGRADESSHP